MLRPVLWQKQLTERFALPFGSQVNVSANNLSRSVLEKRYHLSKEGSEILLGKKGEHAARRTALNAKKKSRGFNFKATGEVELGADLQSKVNQLKENTEYGACGHKGHWRGDPECPMNKCSGASSSSSPPAKIPRPGGQSAKGQKFAKKNQLPGRP